MAEPLPCPFCGHAPERAEMVLTDGHKYAAIECQGCGAVGPEIRLSKLRFGPDYPWEETDYAAAVAEWNRRAGGVL